MKPEDVFALTCNLLGVAVFVASLQLEVNVLRMLANTRSQKSWRALTYLTGFFMLGYAFNFVGILLQLEVVNLVLGGLVYALGAVFVYLVVLTSLRTYRVIFEEMKEEDDAITKLEA
ncbi:MAG: hypothetical protein Kow0069_25190 [Promethearchaeota archaeon]